VPELAAVGIEAGTFAGVGSATAVTRLGAAGLSYNDAQWHIEEQHGELVLTTVGERAYQVSSAPTGVQGSVGADGRIRLAD
jgi:hypothetical protein